MNSNRDTFEEMSNPMHTVNLNSGEGEVRRQSVQNAKFHTGVSRHNILSPGNINDGFDQNANRESNHTEQTSEPVSRTTVETISWGAMQTVVMAVASRTISELTCPEKSLEAAFVLAVTVPLSVEYLKKMFNFSGALKKELPFHWQSNLAQVAFLAALAPTLFYTGFNRKFSAIGYDASIIVPGICLKLLANYGEALFYHDPEGIHAPLLQEDIETGNVNHNEPDNADERSNVATDVPTATWSNWCAMHVAARLLLLFCATNAGGQFFEGMHIPLAEGIEAAGLTNFGGIVAISVVLNEIIGSHLFKASGLFKEVHPNLIPRLVTLFGLAIVLQAANVMKEVNMVNFVMAYLIGFITDLVVDTAVEKTGLGKQIDTGVSHLLSQGYACAAKATNSVSSCVSLSYGAF